MKYYLRLETHNPAYPGYYFWTNGGWSKDHPIIFYHDVTMALNKLSTEQKNIIESSWKVTIEGWDERDETSPSLANQDVDSRRDNFAEDGGPEDDENYDENEDEDEDDNVETVSPITEEIV